MYRISKIKISRFRSNFNIELPISGNKVATICGANNSGKTNTLRAINLFFNPHLYKRNKDVPFHKLQGSRGASQYPEISIELTNNEEVVYITKKFGKDDGVYEEIKGFKKVNSKNKIELSSDDIDTILQSFEVYFIESINVNFPHLISKIIDDVYEQEFENKRINKELRDAFDKYIKTVLGKLNELAENITDDFKQFSDNWGVEFASKTDVRKFTDLINDDIEFFIKDRSNKYIDSKGSGLQKLSYFLLIARVIEKQHSKKNVILLVDEPDTYLHDKLQRQLKIKFEELSEKCQIFMTTHSKTLIDTYTLKNVFLYDVSYTEKSYARINEKEIYQTTTTVVNLDNDDGSLKIKEYLGIKEDYYDILNSYNILVEGEADKKYIEELGKYYKIQLPKIEYVSGADNFEKYLSYYNSIYSKEDKTPSILILLDNDAKGNEVFLKLQKKIPLYKNLKISMCFTTAKKVYTEYINHEIEDLLEPNVVFEIANQILGNAKQNKMKPKCFQDKIKVKAYQDKGILFILELCKSEANPSGSKIEIQSENFKNNLAKNFSIEGNKKIINLLNAIDKKTAMESLLEFIANKSNHFDT